MSPFYDHNFVVGILGGGQLGRMFIQEAVDLDVAVHILDPDPEAPCSNIAHDFIVGDIKDFQTVYDFGKDKDLVTIEIEHVNVDALEKLEAEGVAIYPQPSVIRIVQDKGLQKEFYKRNQIPTAGFELLEENPGVDRLKTKLPFVQKLRKGGYDGRGVQVLRSESDLDKHFSEPSVAEELIDFEKELSVIVARNVKGEIKSYPIVELEFNPEANLVEFLFSPADVSNSIEEESKKIAETIIEKLEMVGILAVELFLTKSGEVLVNEIAPRPHNSGHQTIEANYTSQYAQHLRAILGLPLGSTKVIMPSVMVNVLGEKGFSGKVKYQGLNDLLSIEGIYPHIYGKQSTKPFRKMGHVTVVHESLEEAVNLAKWVNSHLKVISE